ncbi:MAG: DUF4145 domain-containing protein [Nanoarchaeota archaeon]|nr:DUF4145 domain-containing protein [Nanoarchaeota archaeon]
MEHLKLLNEYKRGISDLKSKERFSKEFKNWKYETEDLLIEIFGEDSIEVERFNKIRYTLSVATSVTPDSEFQMAYIKGLENAEALLDSTINKIKRKPTVREQKEAIPDEILDQLPKPLQAIIKEINGCYKNGYLAACSVMCRKAIEAAIHIRFSIDEKEDELKDSNDEFYKLPKKIELAKQAKYISATHARNLSKIRWFGDAGAHSYKINLLRDDIGPNIQLVRLVVEELFYKDV